MIEFIFMLTHNDATVANALETLSEVEKSGLRYVGFKDVGQPTETLTRIADAAHEAGLQVMLEVVSTSAEDEIRSIEAALQIGVDWVLGGLAPIAPARSWEGASFATARSREQCRDIRASSAASRRRLPSMRPSSRRWIQSMVSTCLPIVTSPLTPWISRGWWSTLLAAL
jgi:hypothetical protein